MWTVGVDLGSESVKIVCLAKKKNEYRLISYGLFHREHPELIRETLQHPNLKRANIRVALKDSMVKIRKLELPPAPPEDLDQMVKMAMSQNLPEPIASYILRYQPEQKIVLISEKKQIDEYLLELRQFGIVNPAILEPNSNTLVHAALYNHPLSNNQRYAIVDIGHSAARFSVVSEYGLVFGRNLSEASGADLLALQNADAKTALMQWLYKVAIEIQNSIENYQIQFPGVQVGELLLTGGISKFQGLSAYVQDTLKIKTGFLKAFQKINTSGFPHVLFEDLEQNYATAIGLAL